MSRETPTPDGEAAIRALRVAGVPETVGHDPPDPAAVTAVGDGVNDVFVVPLGERRVVVKFATFSTAADLRAGVAAYRVLGARTDLPVPAVYAFAEGPVDLPPFVVLEHLPGDPLAADFDDSRVSDPDAVRLLGHVLRAFGRVPPVAAEGYGMIQRPTERTDGPCAVAEYDDFPSWLVDYGTRFLADPPDHEAVAAAAPRAADHLRTERERLPAAPAPAVVVTDLSPGNLLSPDGTPPADSGGLTGVLDLERAKV